MTRKSWIVVVAYLAVTAIAGSYLILGQTNIRPWRSGDAFSMSVSDTFQLSPGSPVLLRGIEVGEVTKVSPQGGAYPVKLEIELLPGKHLRADSEIKIEQLSAVGEPYLNFTPNGEGGPNIANGAAIEGAAVQPQLTLPEIFRATSAITNGVESGPLATLLETASVALSVDPQAWSRIREAGNLLAGTLQSKSPQLERMFRATSVYQSNIGSLAPSIEQVGPTLDHAMATFAHALDSLQAINDLTGTPAAFHEVLGPVIERLNPQLEKLLSITDDLIMPIAPVATALINTIPALDLSALLTQALNTIGGDGAKLTVNIPVPSGP